MAELAAITQDSQI